jgi:hypothetical protein
MAVGKSLDKLSDKEKQKMKSKAEVVGSAIKTRFMTIRSEEIAAVSIDEPHLKNVGGNLNLIFKSGHYLPLKYNNLKERDKDFKVIDEAISKSYDFKSGIDKLSQEFGILPAKNLENE